MKKLVSTGLSVAMVISVCNTSLVSNAYAPTDYHDYKCIDIRKLDVGKNFIKKDKNVCDCKTCSFAAMTYDKISDYITDLEKEFEVLSKEKYIPEVATKISIIESILDRLSDSITLEHYKNKNFLLVSANTLPRDLSTNVNFGKKDGITYETTYTENYFDNLKETKVQPFLENVKAFRKNNEGKVDYNDLAGFFKEFFSLFGVCLISSAALVSVAVSVVVNGKSIVNKISTFFSGLNKKNQTSSKTKNNKQKSTSDNETIKESATKASDDESLKVSN